ncbi:MAG: YraN family protein [Thermodesulfobacteriota bacterium]|nr:YraN family protein [Thermodesulfobacteriota bacterium]
MTRQRISLGRRGEEVAVSHLKRLKYKIIERNYTCKFGEIDIIAKDKKTLAFVEVKTRTSIDYVHPYQVVNKRKQHQISKAALNYISQNNLHNMDARFDVVAVQLSFDEEKVELIKNAFELSPYYA